MTNAKPLKAAKTAAVSAVETASDIAETIGTKAAGVKQDATKAVENLTEQGSELIGAADEKLRLVAGEATDFVRRNPAVAIAGAVGLGILLGLAAKRNS